MQLIKEEKRSTNKLSRPMRSVSEDPRPEGGGVEEGLQQKGVEKSRQQVMDQGL